MGRRGARTGLLILVLILVTGWLLWQWSVRASFPAPSLPSPSPTPTLRSSATPVPSPTPTASPVAPVALQDPPPPSPTPTPTPGPPPLSSSDWVRGPEEAKVTLIEYADFQCLACATLAGWLTRLSDEVPGGVRLVYRHYPLPKLHDRAVVAAEVAEAAGAQGRFWAMHDLLYWRQDEWTKVPEENLLDLWVGYARELGLDTDRFRRDLESRRYRRRVLDAYQAAASIPMAGVPTLFINGVRYRGPLNRQSLSAMLQVAAQRPLYPAPPPMTLDLTHTYTATLVTRHGEIVIRLHPEWAPQAVNSFVFLARQGWYDGLPFHTVLPGRLAVTGDPSGTGLGGPGYYLPDEIIAALRFNRPGRVALANEGWPNTGGSQFFITAQPAPELDGRYTIFGQVVSGLEVLDALTPSRPGPEGVRDADLLERVIIEER